MRTKFSNTLNVITKLIGSRLFFYIVIGLFILQALWIAFSFRFPMIYDEGTHLSFIQMYSNKILPYTTDTPGNMTTQISLFHYSMSFVYRFVHLFTNSVAINVIVLRILDILFFTAGIVIFARVFKHMKIRSTYVNSGIFLFTLIPMIPLVAATVNYDNMLFLMTALYTLVAVKIVRNRQIIMSQYLLLIALGCIASLVKYTFLPLFAASIVFIICLIIKRNGRKTLNLLKESWITSLGQKKKLGLYFAFAVLAVGLFSAVFIRNLAVYKSVTPDCTDLYSKKTCLKNGVYRRNITAEATAQQRSVVSVPNYTYQIWLNNMITTTDWSANTTTSGIAAAKPPLPIMNSLIFFGGLAAMGFLLYSWRSIKKDASWYFATILTVSLLIAVYVENVTGYYDSHAAYANQPRYLIPILPLFFVMVTTACGAALRNSRWLKVTIFVITLLIFSQGGGIITHILRSDDSWYWQNATVIKLNHAAKKILRPLVKEN